MDLSGLNSGTVKLYIRQTTKDDGRFKQLDNGEGEVTVSLAYDGSGRLMVDSLESSNPIYRNFIAGYKSPGTDGSTSPSTPSPSSSSIS